MTRPWDERSTWSAALTIGLWMFTLAALTAGAASGVVRTLLLVVATAGFVVAGVSGVTIWFRFGFRSDDAQWPLWHARAGPRPRSRWALVASVVLVVAAMGVWFAFVVVGVNFG